MENLQVLAKNQQSWWLSLFKSERIETVFAHEKLKGRSNGDLTICKVSNNEHKGEL
jgi:hypothetical protein